MCLPIFQSIPLTKKAAEESPEVAAAFVAVLAIVMLWKVARKVFLIFHGAVVTAMVWPIRDTRDVIVFTGMRFSDELSTQNVDLLCDILHICAHRTHAHNV